MDNQNLEAQEPELSPSPVKKKKKKAGPFLLLFLLLLAAAVAAATYLYERRQPEKAVESYLTSIQKMDFTAMERLLQSNDLSALDNADVRNAAYEEFFKNINGKMSFQIVKNQFDFQSGTARVTARIRYIDGSEIYKETVSEFLRQVVAEAFSGEKPGAEETQQKLASILSEKSASLEDTYSETDIVYPVIKTNDSWKIVALDEETVKLMSANFKSVEDEINQTLENADAAHGEENAPSGDAASKIDMTTEKFTIRYSRHVSANDFAGAPCLLVYYDYTNNSGEASSAMVDVNLQAFQNGQALEAAIPETNDDAIDHFMAEIQPGETVSVCQAFSLTDTSPVTLQAGEAFSFGGGASTTQILTLQ